MEKIITNLWFDNQAEEAVAFYASIFKKFKIGKITRYGKAGFEIHKMQEGTIMTIEFQINGSRFLALNGGPVFKFNEAISFIVNCKTQEKIDYYWERLSEGGDPNAQQCGWLKDKYDLSWQIVPVVLTRFLNDPDTKKSQRVMNAMLSMKKIDIKKLTEAYK